MTRTADFVTLEVGGHRLDVWTAYSVDSDILQPADAFEFQVEVGAGPDRVSQDRFRQYREQLSPGSAVRLYVGDDVSGQRRDRYLQLTGRIDSLDVAQSRTKGTVLRVSGRDHGAYLVDSCVPVGLVREEGTAFLDLVRACRPDDNSADDRVRESVAWGPGPRAAQALMLTVRARAMLQSRLAPDAGDVAALAQPVLGHRMALNFAARARGDSLDALIARTVEDVTQGRAAA